MQLEKIRLINFKNYEDLKLDFDPKMNCLVGLNGMGKTNVLDAIYYCCMSKSHFAIQDAHIIRHEESFFRLEANFKNEDKKSKIVVKLQSKKPKVFELNDAPYEKLIDHIGRYPIVMISPDDTQLATEGSEARRKLIDNTLSQLSPDYLMALITYNGIVKQRNAALKLMYQQHNYNATLINIYNEQLLEPAQKIHEARKQFLTQLNPIFIEFYKTISGNQEQVEMEFVSDMLNESLENLFLKNTEKDRILQRTSEGPHRDDIQFSINGQLLKRFASQGQLKSFILALKLAQYELLRLQKGIVPILLLDDIFDKLDPNRVAFLLDLLLTPNIGQVFISDTHTDRIANILSSKNQSYKVFEIENGNLKA